MGDFVPTRVFETPVSLGYSGAMSCNHAHVQGWRYCEAPDAASTGLELLKRIPELTELEVIWEDQLTLPGMITCIACKKSNQRIPADKDSVLA